MTDEPTTTPRQRLARRYMAWLALVALCSMAAGAYLCELGAANADLLVAIAYVLGAVVLGYMGAQIAPDVFRRKP